MFPVFLGNKMWKIGKNKNLSDIKSPLLQAVLKTNKKHYVPGTYICPRRFSLGIGAHFYRG